VPDNRVADRINILIKEFAPFLHFGRHEQLPIVSIGPNEAQVALQITGALISYISKS
jgi:hypothetical protein